MRSWTLRARIAAAFAVGAIVAAVFYAGSAVTAFLLYEREEAAAQAAGIHLDEDAENLAIALGLVGGMAVASPVVAALAAALGWWLSGKALAPLRDAAGRAVLARAGGQDLLLPVRGLDDEWDRLATVVNDLLRDQRSAMDRARSFSAHAAHELRTPLTSILGNIQVALRRERTGEEYRALLADLEAEATHLGALVDVLLTLARADSGELRAGAVRFDLGEVAADVVGAARRRPGPRADLALEISAAPAHGDPLLTRRVLANLVENALRHGAPPVEVRVWAAGDLVLASVTDAGPGLPAAVRARLFERFNREPGAAEGFGLGHAIAHTLAAAQGGRLRLDEAAAVTRFVLELPRDVEGADGLRA